MLTIAVSRGRIWDDALPMLKTLGMTPNEEALESRRLVIPTADPKVELLQTRSQDAPAFVARGVAQAGIAGRDVLAEKRMAEIICPVDLKFAACRIIVAGTSKDDPTKVPNPTSNRPVMVATKYPNLARKYFADRGFFPNIIKLHGKIELAPQVGIADMIVDIADSGKTLLENGLTEYETLMQVSAMWIVNRAAARRRPEVMELQWRVAEYVAKQK